jgi:hypothetical protein
MSALFKIAIDQYHSFSRKIALFCAMTIGGPVLIVLSIVMFNLVIYVRHHGVVESLIMLSMLGLAVAGLSMMCWFVVFLVFNIYYEDKIEDKYSSIMLYIAAAGGAMAVLGLFILLVYMLVAVMIYSGIFEHGDVIFRGALLLIFGWLIYRMESARQR